MGGKVTHNMAYSRLYITWANMKARCLAKSGEKFRNYSGRGISICNDWEHFEPFMDWALNNNYSNLLELDRINTNGNYEPGNCRFVTKVINANNKRNNVHLAINGVERTLGEWSSITGIPADTFRKRMGYGWTNEQYFLIPVKGRDQFTTR